jgi:3-deoxy-7-phosphoheptulonate synthase
VTSPALQQPQWPDRDRLEAVVRSLESLPPLVLAAECDQLKERLAAVARGEAFLLQGGDCAETFAGTSADSIAGKFRTLLQMAVVLTYAASVPVVKVGRMAGQFGKPRSAATEVRDGVELPVYRGDAVNGIEFTAAARTPDPGRLLEAHRCSSATLNLCRSLASGGYADLRQVHAWNQDFVGGSPAGRRYEQLADEIDRAIAFMHACGADPREFRAVEFYSSHEALLLDYERALTRTDVRNGHAYDLSAHLLWIGERTRAVDGAHVDFARQIRNPVAVKIGPEATRPRARARAAHPDHPDGREPDPAGAALAGREGGGQRGRRGLGVRPDARQHGRGGQWPEDQVLRRRAGRGRRLLRGAPRAGHSSRRHPHRIHRR